MKALTLVFCLLLTFVLVASGQPTNAFIKAVDNPKVRGNPFAPVKDEPGLPRVLLIGDSISIGYTMPVQSLLKGQANVHRIPDNGGPTTEGLAKLQQWLGNGKWDVIHFNWGLHDLKIMPDGKHEVPLEDYKSNLQKLVRQLKATGAILIWATTTPVPKEEAQLIVKRKATDVPTYNAAALKIMKENHILVDDLYSLVLPQESKIQWHADVHYRPAGYRVLADQVATSIEAALATKKK